MLMSTLSAFAGQAPSAAEQPDIAVSEHDRFYTSDQFSNTVSVINPASNKLLGVVRLGDPTPGNLSPLYRGQLLVHGMGFSPDHHTLLAVSIGSNSVSFIDTVSNTVKHVTYVGRSPHEAFFTPDGKEVWVSVRGENYVAVLDGQTYREKSHIEVPNGPGMTIFSPDGKFGYVLQPGDGYYSDGHQTDCRPGEAGKSILSRHCGYPGWETGLVYAQRHRQGNGLQCPAAVRIDKGA
jgi:YVTN family beta-propeller protein